ncbi:hypothetical protein [Alicyclobacillus sp.]|uniref:hypothetical protein n=1 Tax=Alicyclobacillus sp. TaxID=61169 RepID=UPI0025BA4140|nr:hypothetical protein [Alicyclobacillus sp.]MCL6516226.1 hypothetical protein [Alicyclobacillus sp.]
MRRLAWAQPISAWIWVGVLAAVYGVSASALAEETGLSPDAGSARAALGAPATYGSDVPDQVVQTVAASVGTVTGLDELVVLPNQAGGYTVSAEVELGIDAADAAVANPMMERLSQTFFQRVYGCGANVTDAQLYFMAGGQLVGGADLGRDAYRRLDVSALTAPDAFLQAVQALPVRTGEGADDSWVQWMTLPPDGQGGDGA